MTLLEALREEFKERDSFPFESESFPLTVWTVYKTENGLRCTCPGSSRRHVCKHQKFLYRWVFGYDKLTNYWGKQNDSSLGTKKRSQEIS